MYISDWTSKVLWVRGGDNVSAQRPEIQKLNLDALLALMPYRRFSSWLSIDLNKTWHLGGERQTFQYCLLYNGFGLGLDTNITKNRLNMFAEIPDFFF